MLNGGSAPLQRGRQCIGPIPATAEIPGQHGVTRADGTDDPVHRRVAPHGAVGVDEDSTVTSETGQHGAGTAAA